MNDTDRVNKFPEWRHDGETIPRNEDDVVESGRVNVIQKMMANERESKSILNGLKSIVRRILAILKLL